MESWKIELLQSKGILHSDTSSDELYHHGVLGMKWGVRRYQNPDGSLTAAGKEHYGYGSSDGRNTAKSSSSKCPKDMKADVIAANGGKGSYSNSAMRHNNCAFCSVAYEMRRRGENVRAQDALEGVSQEAIEKAVKNLKKSDIQEFAKRTTIQGKSLGMSEKEFDHMTEIILKDGDNSRGQVSLYWKAIGESGFYSGGHALNYEVKDGIFYLVDSQIGRVMSGKQAYRYLSNACDVKTFRTDDKQFDKKITEKYYTEDNTGKITSVCGRKVVNSLNATAGVVSSIGLLAFMSPVITLETLAVGAAAAAAGGLITIPANILNKSVTKKEKEQQLALEEKWQKEDRMKFYNSGNKVSSSDASRARSLRASGYTMKEIANKLGVSVSTVNNILN